jgi:hypothetical protein
MPLNIAYEISPSYCSDLNMLKNLRRGTESFTSPPKEVLLRNFVVLKSPLYSAGFEPVNLGSSGKDDNHQTTEGDF